MHERKRTEGRKSWISGEGEASEGQLTHLVSTIVHLNIISIHIDMLIGIVEHSSYGTREEREKI